MRDLIEPDLIGHYERLARPFVRWKSDQTFDKGGKVTRVGENHGLRAIARKDAYFVLQIDKYGPGHHVCRLSVIRHAEVVKK